MAGLGKRYIPQMGMMAHTVHVLRYAKTPSGSANVSSVTFTPDMFAIMNLLNDPFFT